MPSRSGNVVRALIAIIITIGAGEPARSAVPATAVHLPGVSLMMTSDQALTALRSQGITP